MAFHTVILILCKTRMSRYKYKTLVTLKTINKVNTLTHHLHKIYTQTHTYLQILLYINLLHLNILNILHNESILHYQNYRYIIKLIIIHVSILHKYKHLKFINTLHPVTWKLKYE